MTSSATEPRIEIPTAFRATPAACLLSAPLNDRLGVPRVIQLMTPLNLLAWPLMTFTHQLPSVLAGAVLAGAVVGLSSVNGRLFIAEVSNQRPQPMQR